MGEKLPLPLSMARLSLSVLLTAPNPPTGTHALQVDQSIIDEANALLERLGVGLTSMVPPDAASVVALTASASSSARSSRAVQPPFSRSVRASVAADRAGRSRTGVVRTASVRLPPLHCVPREKGSSRLALKGGGRGGESVVAALSV
jgi:hypothetical protein